jgi:uncharacterized protein YrrD
MDEDLGAPVSHLVLAEGVPVYDRGGHRMGVVDHVMADDLTGIFEGLIIHTLPLPGRHVYAHFKQIAELRERGVLLSVDADALHELSESSARRRGPQRARESPLHAALRKAWDWLTGVR